MGVRTGPQWKPSKGSPEVDSKNLLLTDWQPRVGLNGGCAASFPFHWAGSFGLWDVMWRKAPIRRPDDGLGDPLCG